MTNEYYGDSIKDARISIDYKDNSYVIEYPEKPTQWEEFKELYFNFFSIYFRYFVLWIFMFFLIASVIYLYYTNQINAGTVKLTEEDKDILKILAMSFGYLWLPPAVPSMYLLINRNIGKRSQKLFCNELIKNQGYREKIIKKLNGKRFIIPYTENKYIKYWVTEDFKKYIEKVNIKDFEFNEMKDKGKLDFKDRVWYVEFLFSEIPKQGYLKVIWI